MSLWSNRHAITTVVWTAWLFVAPAKYTVQALLSDLSGRAKRVTGETFRTGLARTPTGFGQRSGSSSMISVPQPMNPEHGREPAARSGFMLFIQDVVARSLPRR